MIETNPNAETANHGTGWFEQAYRSADTPIERISILLAAFRDLGIDPSRDLTCGLVPGLELNVRDLAAVYAQFWDLQESVQGLNAPAEAPVDTGQACRDAYAALLAARTALTEAERAHFQGQAGGRP